MISTEQTIQQLERLIRKISEKFPAAEEATMITDIHLHVSQDGGEILAFDDNGEEITRCMVDQWIDNKEENFYQEIVPILRGVIHDAHETVDNLGILKPYSFVLEDEDGEEIAELYLADDDTVIIGGNLMQGLDDELDDFFKKLFE